MGDIVVVDEVGFMDEKIEFGTVVGFLITLPLRHLIFINLYSEQSPIRNLRPKVNPDGKKSNPIPQHIENFPALFADDIIMQFLQAFGQLMWAALLAK